MNSWLSIVQNLVCMHGGWVEVQSPGTDKGTTFTVTLPLRNDACAKFKNRLHEKKFIQMSRSQTPQFLDGVKILFLDINNPKASYFKTMLRSLGATVLDAFDHTQELENEFEAKISVVIFCSEGFNFNEFDLTKITQLIKSFQFEKVPYVYLGKNISDHEANSLFGVGIDGVVSTPINAICLSKVISTLI